MGTQYVDDHRFLLYQESGVLDITEAVSGPELRDELTALSVEVRFTAVRNDKMDRYMHWAGIAPGNKLRIVNHGTEVFSGVVLTVGLDGSVTANDPGWYLTKSQIVLQLDGAAAADAVARMCAKAGIAVGVVRLPPTRISKVWVGATPERILQDILAICTAETGLTYRRRVLEGKLCIEPLPTAPITAYHKPADGLPAFDITLAKGKLSGDDSMADQINSVVLAERSGGAARVLGWASNAASIARYGLLQQVESLSGDETTAQARQRVKTLLDQQDRLSRERTVKDIFGCDEVTSGVLLNFVPNRYDVSGPMRVTGVIHRYGATHTMTLMVSAQQPRAAGSGDTITV